MAKQIIQRSDYISQYVSEVAKAKEWLRTNKVIDKHLNILDYPLFGVLNKQMRDEYKSKYNLDYAWFTSEAGGKRAVPNVEMFYQIDVLRKLPYTLGSSSVSGEETVSK